MKFRNILPYIIMSFLFSALGCLWFISFAWAKTTTVDPKWYEFSLSPELEADAPANLGKLSLDAPAGKYGFVSVNNANFVFSDNKRIRFWGTNLAKSACFPDKPQAEKIAADLAFFGFNSVRLSGLDFAFAPEGIFEDVGAEHRDLQLKTTRYLNAGQLDKLDYLIYQLKTKGIYICLNLLSSRDFTQADGIVEAELLDPAGGAATVFDDDLIALQKDYAKKLLNHVNKYTQLKYNEDPAIALIELTDKNSLIQAWKNNLLNGNLFGEKTRCLSNYYAKQLDYSWNEQLRKKYGSVENLRKNWPKTNGLEPTPALNKVNWQLEANQQAKATLKIKDNLIHIKIRSVSAKPDDIQYRADYLNLFKNSKYVLSCTISADKNMNIEITAEQVFSPWDNLGLDEKLAISPVPRMITIPFSPNMDCAKAEVSFMLGQSKGKINITDLELKQIDSLPIIDNEASLTQFNFHRPLYELLKLYPQQEVKDITDFYIWQSNEYFKTMTNFLKKECGVKVPITGIAGATQVEDMSGQTGCDYLSAAAYWDYPQSPARNLDITDFKINNNSVLQEVDLGILGKIHSVNPNTPEKKKIPFIVSQWSQCFPNQFAYESPTLLGSVAGNNNWDGLFQYAYCLNSYDNTSKNMISDFFETINNPQQLLLCSIAGLAFHYEFATPKIKGLCGFTGNKVLQAGSITVKPADDGAIFLCALDKKPAEESSDFLLVALSEVKNTNSGWGKTGFNWGNEPVLLKRVNLEISIPANKDAIVFVLDNRGKRGQRIKLEKTKDITTFNPKDFNSPWFEILLKP
jgi:hypothetical protein